MDHPPNPEVFACPYTGRDGAVHVDSAPGAGAIPPNVVGRLEWSRRCEDMKGPVGAVTEASSTDSRIV